MRKGNRPSLLLTPAGEIFAIATGSDATAEHEWGCAPLMRELTGCEPLTRQVAASGLRSKPEGDIPDVLAGRHITRDLDALVFEEGVEHPAADPAAAEPVAVLGYSARHMLSHLLEFRELAFPRFGRDSGLAGAWDDSSFAFKVRGQDNVERLRRFYQAMQQGKAMFAGLFLDDIPGVHAAGVIICNTEHLNDEHRAAMDVARERFREGVRRLLPTPAPAEKEEQ